MSQAASRIRGWLAQRAPDVSVAPSAGAFQTDVLLMLASKAVLVLSAGVGSIAVARALGPSGRGDVAVAVSFIALLAYLGNVGLVSANQYFVARDGDTRARIVANSLWLSAALGLALIGITLALKLWVPQLLTGLDGLELALVAIGIPAALAAMLFRSILLGEGRTVAYNGSDVVIGLLFLGALFLGLLVFNFGTLGVIALVVGNQVAACGTAVALVVARGGPGRADWPLARGMVKYAMRAYLAALAAYLVIRVDLLLVNAYLGNEQAGQYAVAVNLADMLYLFPAIVALNLFPRIARGATYEATALVFRVVAISYGVVCLMAALLAYAAVGFVYGSEFTGAIPLFLWLVPGLFSLGLLNILAQHFAGTGYPLRAVIVWLPGVVVVLGLDLALIPVYGAYVASIASSIGYTLVLILHMRLFAETPGGYAQLRPRFREAARTLYRAIPGRHGTAFGAGGGRR